MAAQSEPARDRIAQRLHDPLGALGLDLESLELTPAGRRRLLRVSVDGDDGVSLDAVADATRAVSRVLDEDPACQAALGEQPYTLEVTSRGVDRPLTLPRHWRRNRRRLVRVTLDDGRTVTGRIGASDDDAVQLDVDGTEQRVRFAEVGRALVQVEFNRAAQDAAEDLVEED